MTQRVHAVTMPKWGMTMTEGKVRQWVVAPGDRLGSGTELVEIERRKQADTIDHHAQSGHRIAPASFIPV